MTILYLSLGKQPGFQGLSEHYQELYQSVGGDNVPKGRHCDREGTLPRSQKILLIEGTWSSSILPSLHDWIGTIGNSILSNIIFCTVGDIELLSILFENVSLYLSTTW